MKVRTHIERLPDMPRRVLVGVVGGMVVVAGIIMIPYPGPGWLVVFVGLSVLATEFSWAHRVHISARKRYQAWQEWLTRQPTFTKSVVVSMTAIVTIVTVWLCNGYGIINSWLRLNQDWLNSPFI